MLAKLRKIAKSLWLLVATSGLVSIVVGLVAMIRPQLVLSVFIYLFGVLVLLISAIILGKSLLSVKKDNLWWTSMIFAVCGISIGTMVLANPIVAQAFIAAILAIYIFIQSLLGLIATSYSEDNESKPLVTTIGIIGVILGFLVLFQPRLATTGMMWIVGIYIFAYGLVAEYYAIRTYHKTKTLRQAIRKAERGVDQSTKTKHDPDDIAEAEVVRTKAKSADQTQKD